MAITETILIQKKLKKVIKYYLTQKIKYYKISIKRLNDI